MKNLSHIVATWAFFMGAVCSSAISGGIPPAVIEAEFPKDNSSAPDTRSTMDPFAPHSAADLSIPKATELFWIVPPSLTASKTSVLLSGNSVDGPWKSHHADTGNSQLELWNLKLGTRYFWKVFLEENSGQVLESRVFSFTSSSNWPRMIHIEGVTNVRDIGGVRNTGGHILKQGLVYRSGGFFAITENGKKQIMALGIVRQIDLLGSSENPEPELPIEIEYFRPPYIGGTTVFSYWRGLQDFKSHYRDIFKKLAETNHYPVVISCYAGSDRTGTVIALLEALLGCSDAHILLDYQWSSLSIYGSRGKSGAYGWNEWKELIEGIRSYDKTGGTLQKGAYNYLLSIGVSAMELETIKSWLLEAETVPVHGRPQGPKALLGSIRRSPDGIMLRNCSLRPFSVTVGGVFDCRGRFLGSE